jgi:hypothetical protein
MYDSRFNWRRALAWAPAICCLCPRAPADFAVKNPCTRQIPIKCTSIFRAQGNFGLVHTPAKCFSGCNESFALLLDVFIAWLYGRQLPVHSAEVSELLGYGLLLPPTEELIDEVPSIRRSINCPRSPTETIGVACALRCSKRKRSHAVSSRRM